MSSIFVITFKKLRGISGCLQSLSSGALFEYSFHIRIYNMDYLANGHVGKCYLPFKL
jgi:hypothetical protein